MSFTRELHFETPRFASVVPLILYPMQHNTSAIQVHSVVI